MKLKLLFLPLVLLTLTLNCKTELLHEKGFLHVESDRIMLTAQSHDTLIYVTTNLTSWMPKATEELDWIKLEKSYSGGQQCFRLRVSSNPNNKIRTVEVNIEGEGIEFIPIKISQHGQDAAILVDKETISLSKAEGRTNITITSNVPVGYKVDSPFEWLSVSTTKDMINTSVSLTYGANASLTERSAVLKIFSTDESVALDTIYIPVTQAPSLIEDLLPEGDEQIRVVSAIMVRGNVYGTQTVEKTIDGNYSTNYSGNKTSQKDSVIFDYTLEENADIVNYVKLTQRQDQDRNSTFSEGSVWAKSKGDTDWNLKCNFEVAQGKDIVAQINVANPVQIRICLQRNTNNNVALAEFECFKSSADIKDIQDAAIYFADETYSELKPGVTSVALKNIKSPIISSLAFDLLNNKYEKSFRVRTYKSTANPIETAKSLTIGSRSQCDNPTGIFFEANKPLILFVENSMNTDVVMLIRDFRETAGSQRMSLSPGINFVTPKVNGNGYIQHWNKAGENMPAVKMHVLYGNEIGFWDVRNGDTDETWAKAVERAELLQQKIMISNLMLDVLGEKVQLCNTVNAFKNHAPKQIAEIMRHHDELMNLEYEMMGLIKYDAVPSNRMLGLRSWGGSPNWNGFSANYPNSEAIMLVKDKFLSNIWVFGHEFGHGNQVAQMKDAGWTEVTNNLFSTYVQYMMCDRTNLRLEHEGYKFPGSSVKVKGDRINNFFNEAYVNNIPYLEQAGGINEEGVSSADPFVSLVPLWQLTLFFKINEGAEWHRPDFWADIHWGAINDNNKYTYGERYVNFMKRAIGASGYNLAPFFEKIGLLRVGDRMVGDYGSPKQVKITQTMVNEVKSLGETKQSLGSVAIEYITAHSLDIFKEKRAISGIENQGVTNTTGGKSISSDAWQNAVAFETYENEKLLHVSFFGTGTSDKSSTFVRFPDNATHIKAVSWDGKRVNILSK